MKINRELYCQCCGQEYVLDKESLLRNPSEGFRDGSVVKNLPTNAGNTGLIPDLGGSHMAQSKLSLCSRAQELQLLSPCAAKTRAHAP